MKYVITLSLECTYEIDADFYTEDEAKMLAERWFTEAEPHVTIQKLAPCQLGEKCPYDHETHCCGDCR